MTTAGEHRNYERRTRASESRKSQQHSGLTTTTRTSPDSKQDHDQVRGVENARWVSPLMFNTCIIVIPKFFPAEYMDPKTLRDRVNDVINTIIRHDDSTENEEFLQPCIK
ncbi:hypothetical protein Dimus_005935, partial [Dionaea muscipula]